MADGSLAAFFHLTPCIDTMPQPSSDTAVPSPPVDEPLRVGGMTLASRLVVGTGKYASHAAMQQCLEASGTDCVTVAVRRERLVNAAGENILDHIDTSRYVLLPNTAGCYTADDAVRVARLGRELLRELGNPGAEWVKLEVLGDQRTLLPDPVGTLEATGRLVQEGFTVLVYTSDDPVVAKRLKDLGAASVMPAAASWVSMFDQTCSPWPVKSGASDPSGATGICPDRYSQRVGPVTSTACG